MWGGGGGGGLYLFYVYTMYTYVIYSMYTLCIFSVYYTLCLLYVYLRGGGGRLYLLYVCSRCTYVRGWWWWSISLLCVSNVCVCGEGRGGLYLLSAYSMSAYVCGRG